MDIKTQEMVSVLLDNELDELNKERIIREFCKNEHTQTCLERYQLIRDAIKKNLPERIDHDLSRRITHAIDLEPPHEVMPTKTRHSFFEKKKPLGFALAASVAALAVFSIQWGNLGINDHQLKVSSSNISAPIAKIPTKVAANIQSSSLLRSKQDSGNVQGGVVTSTANSNSAQWDVRQPMVASKLTDYLISHNEYSIVMPMQEGMIPHVRVVGYDYQ